MWKLIAIAVLAAVPAFAGDPLGPSGLPAHEPFSLITETYVDDFNAASKCAGSPKAGGQVFEGKIAVYYKPPNGEVEVLQDEYARRFALDYCWN